MSLGGFQKFSITRSVMFKSWKSGESGGSGRAVARATNHQPHSHRRPLPINATSPRHESSRVFWTLALQLPCKVQALNFC